MVNTSAQRIEEIRESQSRFFATGATRDYKFRINRLKELQEALSQWEQPLCEALWNDLHKSREEAVMTEFSIVSGEIKKHIGNLHKWMKRRKVHTPLKMFPSRSYIINEPLGNTLIISPWNYPVQLILNPLVGAISAGCTAILKPSPYVPSVSSVIEEMISNTFAPEYIAVVQGNSDTNKHLLAQRFDLIFFTGSPTLGRTVMEAAAKNLTPVILELGGKSPCIVDKNADADIAARRIVWGKTLNAGQTCIAPDYLLIHASKKEVFIKAFKNELINLHGDDISKSRHYARMVNDKAFKRVAGYMKDGDILLGGKCDASERFIEPTLLENIAPDSPVMQEEIFGPLLPLITFKETGEALKFINEREKPLALYYFGETNNGFNVLRHTASGGACINDTIMHIANDNLPFGGVGYSGMGRYHGHDSFCAFSYRRSVVVSSTLFDIPFRYMPYKMFAFIKRFL